MDTDSLLRDGAALLKVLLIEDDPAWQHALTVGLGERGVDVRVVPRLQAAAAELERMQPDVVLLDDALPDADGITAIGAMVRTIGQRNIPVVLLSSREDPANMARAFQAGVSDCLPKSMQLTRMCERLLHLSRSVLANALARDGNSAASAGELTEQALRQARESRQQMHVDPLTGLYSRTGFLQRGEAFMKHRRPRGHVAAVLLLNLDRFRNLNESLGQVGGDRVLVEVGQRLMLAFRNLSGPLRTTDGGNDARPGAEGQRDGDSRAVRVGSLAAAAAALPVDPAFVPVASNELDRAIAQAHAMATDSASHFRGHVEPFPVLCRELEGIEPTPEMLQQAAAAALDMTVLHMDMSEPPQAVPQGSAAATLAAAPSPLETMDGVPGVEHYVRRDEDEDEVEDGNGVGVGEEARAEGGPMAYDANADVGPPRLVIARMSGDEFGLFFPGLDSPYAMERAAEIVFAQLRRPLSLDGVELLVRGSIGMAYAPDHGRSVETLLARADTALAMAKRQGGLVAVQYSSEFGGGNSRNFDFETALYGAIDRNELLLHYQPIVDTESGNPIGCEALMRWVRGGQLIAPSQFIPVAEETQMVFEMGEWAISHALQQVRRWQLKGLDIRSVAVNINVRHLLRPSLLKTIMAALDATQLPPSTLSLELTESDVMQDIQKGMKALQALREVGVRLALDDFGTGYSSLAYLAKLPLDVLKIDRSFTHEMLANPQQAAVVRGIVALGAALGLEVTAEGVEKLEELQLLKALQCPRLQGYYFSRPLAAADLELWWPHATPSTRAARLRPRAGPVQPEAANSILV